MPSYFRSQVRCGSKQPWLEFSISRCRDHGYKYPKLQMNQSPREHFTLMVFYYCCYLLDWGGQQSLQRPRPSQVFWPTRDTGFQTWDFQSCRPSGGKENPAGSWSSEDWMEDPWFRSFWDSLQKQDWGNVSASSQGNFRISTLKPSWLMCGS